MTPVGLERVSKRYGRSGPLVLNDVSLGLEPGTVTVLRGRNGSGKTTLLRVLVGASGPSGGTVLRPATVGYVPERFPPGLRFSPREYLRHAERIRGLAGTRIDALVERLGLRDQADLPLATLSKGTRQKVAVAQALLADPDLLVLDEPWNGLDAGAQAELSGVLLEVRERGARILLADHGEAATQVQADRHLHLHDGALVERPSVAQGQRVVVEVADTAARAALDAAVAESAGLRIKRVEPWSR